MAGKELKERNDILERVLAQVKIAFPWMLTDIKTRNDEIKPDDYSPELQHALSVKDSLDAI